MFIYKVLKTGRLFFSINELVKYLEKCPEADRVEVYNRNTNSSIILRTLPF